jgi:ArsR family transcriptional regulator, cadmium/lead-responsive transcriptional repressor
MTMITVVIPASRGILSSGADSRYHRLMAMKSPGAELERTELGPAAALFRSLGDPARLVIVRRLAAGPARVTDLTAALGLAQSTVSKHLACLRDCGLVTSEPAGRASVFRLAQPALADMLTAAEAVLAATGSVVALCPVYGLGACGQDAP